MTNDPQNQNHDQGVMETGAVVEEAVYSLFTRGIRIAIN
jgi:hypothetical protein